MMYKQLYIVILFFVCPLSYADLGQIHVKSYLNQKLLAKIDVNNINDANLPIITIATAEQFRSLGLDYYSDGVLFNSKLIKSDNMIYTLEITSLKPISSPIINLLFHYQTGTNDMYKQYTILLEPINNSKEQK